jgi:hypothetical protein
MLRQIMAALAVFVASLAPAHGAEFCAWLVESEQYGGVRNLDLWLQADTTINIAADIYGRGIVSFNGESNAPGSFAFALNAGVAAKTWNHAAPLDPPGRIEITAEIRKVPDASSFDTMRPLIAQFAFSRDVPAGEKEPPATLAKKQCVEIVDLP